MNQLTLTKTRRNSPLAQTLQSVATSFGQVLLGDGFFGVEYCAEGVEGEEADTAERDLERGHGGMEWSVS